MSKTIHSLFVFSIGCGAPYSELDSSTPEVAIQATAGEFTAPAQWPANFPAPADLAILLDTTDEPLIDFETRNGYGERFLPASWLESVKKAYTGTFAEDAIEDENRDEEWRLVSIRISPCAPIGIRPDVDIDEWCWPAVRLVWQPVVSDFRLSWGVYTDFYADDRAIHAIYPVSPRRETGERISGEWRETVGAHLAQNRRPEALQPHILSGFRAVRDASATAVLSALASLRDPSISSQAYEAFEPRAETYMDDATRATFQYNLRRFLHDFASPHDLDELTSFSLPEGRTPADSDLWIFVGFDGNHGVPTLKQLNVIGRNSGEELVRIGPSQTVAVGVEDTTVEEELSRGNQELEESLIVSSEDIETLGSAMADPYEFLVPNTSCASCHRLNPLRFDFHALSGFENRGISVSPRVEGDVARDLIWTRTALRR